MSPAGTDSEQPGIFPVRIPVLCGLWVIEVGNPMLTPQDAEAASRVAAIFPKE